MISVKRVLLAGLAAAVFASAASATNIYVATNITGAQTQIDINHRSYWTFSTGASVANFTGGSFVMKKGNSANGSVNFAVILGTYQDFLNNYNAGTGVYTNPSAGSLGSIIVDQSLNQTNFGSSFTQTAFSGVTTTLAGGTTFTAVLWSSVPDVQSQAFFVKQGGGDLFWSDSTGTAVPVTGYTTGSNIVTQTSSVPGAGLAAMAGLGLAARRRRR
jgi:MYXO-CTERM domain-containing protein